MTNSRQKLGSWGETQAADYLSNRGYRVLARNSRTPYGEIDIIARHGETVVFIEVKTRSSKSFGLPEQAITPKKQQHMIASAQHYLQNHPYLNGDWRIDVISVLRLPEKNPEITHFENAIHG